MFQFSKKGTAQNRFLSSGKILKYSCRGPAGRCSIPPLVRKEIIKREKIIEELAPNLRAPPCIHRGKQNPKFPPLCKIHEGMICPVDPAKYKYPAYSECRRREGRGRFGKECCYHPPPPCDINLVRDENTN